MLSRAKAVLKDSITPSGMGVIEIHGGKLTNGLVLATADAITTLAGAVDDFKKQYGVSKNKAVDYLLCDALGWPLRAAEAAESAGKSVFLKAKALAPEAKRLGGGGIESLLLAELLAQPWTAAAYAAAQTGDKQPRDALPPPSPVAAPALAALSWAPPLPAPPPPAPPPCPHCTAAAADELGNFLPSMFEPLFAVLEEKPVKRRRIAEAARYAANETSRNTEYLLGERERFRSLVEQWMAHAASWQANWKRASDDNLALLTRFHELQHLMAGSGIFDARQLYRV